MAQKPDWVEEVQGKVQARRKATADSKHRAEAADRKRYTKAYQEEAKPIISSLRQKVERAVERGEHEVPLMTWDTSYGGSCPREPSDLCGAPGLVAQYCKQIGLKVAVLSEELPGKGEDGATRDRVSLVVEL